MLSPADSATALERLFDRERVVDLAALLDVIGTRSRMSVYRHLSRLDYLSSFNHAGRFYTLRRIPTFDKAGLWQHREALFSIDGSLKATVCRLVEQSEVGWTQEELRDRLRVRVHNTLFDLVKEKRISREKYDAQFLYLSGTDSRAAMQLAERGRRGGAVEETRISTMLVIEVLVEVIRGAPAVPSPSVVVARLAARGVAVTHKAVEALYREHGLGKKTAGSRSRLSKR